jgi:hypothetical protein
MIAMFSPIMKGGCRFAGANGAQGAPGGHLLSISAACEGKICVA